MDLSFLNVNYIAVVVSAVLIFIFGSIWFSFLFAKAWVNELRIHNVVIQQPSQNKIFINMGLTFLHNIMSALAMAYLVNMAGSTTCISGLILGAIVAYGFVVTSVGNVFVWENRSIKLFLIDTGYPFFSAILSAIILSIWH